MVVTFFWLWVIFVQLLFLSKIGGHHQHFVNLRSISYHFNVGKQTPTNFLRRIQAKTWTQRLSSNKLVLNTWFGVPKNFCQSFVDENENWAEEKLDLKFRRFAPSIGQDNFRFIAMELRKKPEHCIICLVAFTMIFLNFQQRAQFFKKFSLWK